MSVSSLTKHLICSVTFYLSPCLSGSRDESNDWEWTWKKDSHLLDDDQPSFASQTRSGDSIIKMTPKFGYGMLVWGIFLFSYWFKFVSLESLQCEVSQLPKNHSPSSNKVFILWILSILMFGGPSCCVLWWFSSLHYLRWMISLELLGCIWYNPGKRFPHCLQFTSNDSNPTWDENQNTSIR